MYTEGSAHDSIRQTRRSKDAGCSSRRRCSTGFGPLLVLTALVLLPLAGAHAASCLHYSLQAVTLQGIVTNGDANFTSAAQEFVVSQYAMWRDTGVASHPIEFG